MVYIALRLNRIHNMMQSCISEEDGTNRQTELRRLLYAALSALLVLLAIPVVMVQQTYSNREGYLPPLDAGALPLLYWIALTCAVVLFLSALISERRGWRVRVTVTKENL